MKDQYFGDVNDYRKYGLLRAIQSCGDLRLLVAWMLTPNDPSRDGEIRGYLERPASLDRCDPDLHRGLRRLVARGRSVSRIETSRLLPRTDYYSARVPDGREPRAVWRRGLLEAARGRDLVFLDPDNGIEVKSRPIGTRFSSKYVAWGELTALWEQGASLLIYQHFPRVKRESFAVEIARRLGHRLSGATLEAYRAGNVLFLLVARNGHAPVFERARSLVTGRWAGQITSMALA